MFLNRVLKSSLPLLETASNTTVTREVLRQYLVGAVSNLPLKYRNNNARSTACSLVKCAQLGPGILRQEEGMKYLYQPDRGDPIKVIQPELELNMTAFQEDPKLAEVIEKIDRAAYRLHITPENL